MNLGIITPVVNLNPRVDPPTWEVEGGIAEVITIAKAAEAFGYAWMSCPEHVAIPKAAAQTRGGRYFDPLVTLSFVAANTGSIKLLSHVLVLGYHHPLQIVKSYGTLDTASGGRVILGVGVGSLQEEFELLGAPFENRGERADEAIKAIRGAFGKREPAHDGTYYRFSGFVVEPCGEQVRVPIWVGGRTRRSLRRALDLGDGWIPFGLGFDDLRAMLCDAGTTSRLRERHRDFDIVLAPPEPLDPLRRPDEVAGILDSYRALGATALNVRFAQDSLDQYLRQLEAMAHIAKS